MMWRRFVSLALCALPLFAQGATECNRDIRPILSHRCYTCHGPAVANRQSKLRLDNEQSAKAKLSEIIRRITAGNQPIRMPPAYAGAALSDREITLIKTWIAQGAPW